MPQNAKPPAPRLSHVGDLDALRYLAERGAGLVPLSRAPQDLVAKRPVGNGWQHAAPSVEELVAGGYAGGEPTAERGVGIRRGASPLLAIDIDKGGEAGVAAVTHALGEPLCVIPSGTAGRYHAYYTVPDAALEGVPAGRWALTWQGVECGGELRCTAASQAALYDATTLAESLRAGASAKVTGESLRALLMPNSAAQPQVMAPAAEGQAAVDATIDSALAEQRGFDLTGERRHEHYLRLTGRLANLVGRGVAESAQVSDGLERFADAVSADAAMLGSDWNENRLRGELSAGFSGAMLKKFGVGAGAPPPVLPGEKELLDSSFDTASYQVFIERLGWDFRFNVRTGLEEVRKEPGGEWAQFEDSDKKEMMRFLNDRFALKSGKQVRNATLPWERFDVNWTPAVRENSVDPWLQWLAALPPWDGEKRIDTFPRIYFRERHDHPTKVYAFRYILRMAILRSRFPSCWAQRVPVIRGPQGCGKDEMLKLLFPPEHSHAWLCSTLDVKTAVGGEPKAAAEQLQGAVIALLPEMAGLRKVEIEQIKDFITRANDAAVMKWETRRRQNLRRCIFVGTTNSDTSIPFDETGYRRWIVWQVEGATTDNPADFAYLREARDQLWAEALHEVEGVEDELGIISLMAISKELAWEFERIAGSNVVTHDGLETAFREHFKSAAEPGAHDHTPIYWARFFGFQQHDEETGEGEVIRARPATIMEQVQIKKLLTSLGFEKRRMMKDGVSRYVYRWRPDAATREAEERLLEAALDAKPAAPAVEPEGGEGDSPF